MYASCCRGDAWFAHFSFKCTCRDLSNPLQLDEKYTDETFHSALNAALSDDGILVVSGGQVGYRSGAWKAGSAISQERRNSLLDALVSVEYEVVRDYEQVRCCSRIELKWVDSNLIEQWNGIVKAYFLSPYSSFITSIVRSGAM